MGEGWGEGGGEPWIRDKTALQLFRQERRNNGGERDKKVKKYGGKGQQVKSLHG